MKPDSSLARVSSASRVYFLRRFIWVLAVCIPTAALAADHVAGRAYFEDKSAQLDFAQAKRQEYIPYTGVLNRGYTRSAIWIRLRIDPAETGGSQNAEDAKKLVLRIRPTYLDEIELFDPLQPASSRRLVGDSQPVGNEEYSSLNYNFVIPGGDAPRDVWLRLKTTSTSLIYVEALTRGEIQKGDHKQEIFYSILLAVQLFFIVWALIHWWPRREKLIGIFLLRQFICLIYALSVMGYTRALLGDFLPAIWQDNATSMIILCLIPGAVWFDYQLLREYKPSKWLMRLLLVQAALLPFEIALFFAGQAAWVLHFNAVMLMVEPVTALLLAITAKAWKTAVGEDAPAISRRGLALFYFMLTLMIMISALMVLGIVRAPELVIYSYLVTSVFSGVIIVMLLQLRASRMEQRRLHVFTQLAISEKEVEQERQQRQEQGKFMAMLTHELKTPLSVLRMVLGNHVPSDELRAHADRAVRDMNNIIERCLQTEKLADQKLVMDLQECSLMDELGELGRNSRVPDRLSIHSEIAPLFKTDMQMLRIILANLIDNAMKYSPPESQIQIGVAQDHSPQGEGISIAVQNLPGTAGWPDAEKVFQKYYRSKAAHHQTGSGLGLYLAGTMAHMLGGEIAYAPDDIFIRFKLWLPI